MRRTAAARAVRKASALLVLGYSLAACGGSSEPPPAVATVEVTPAQASRQVGESIQLSATVKDVDGNILSGQPVSWSTSASTVASVSASGLVTAHAVGQAMVTAASGNRSGVATINVLPEPIASITVAPTNDTIFVDETVQLTPTLRDANNNIVTNRQVAWSSNTPAVATVSGSGLVTGVSDGSATITATVDGRTASATIRVHDRCSTELAATISVGQTINGSLATTDCHLDDGTYADGYAIQVTAATNVQIDMTAGFDTWLALLELLPTGGLVERAVNDDVDPDDPNDPNDTFDTNSRIIFTLQPGALYFILANSYDANVTGNYQLKVVAVAPFVTGGAVSGKPGKAPVAELLKALKVKPIRE